MRKTFARNNLIILFLLVLTISIFMGLLSINIAKADEPEYFIRLNNGSEEITAIKIEAGLTLPTAESLNLSKEGFVFLGWSEYDEEYYNQAAVEDGATLDLELVDELIAEERDFVLYAAWEKEVQVTLNIDNYYVLELKENPTDPDVIDLISVNYDGKYDSIVVPDDYEETKTIAYDFAFTLPEFKNGASAGFDFVGWYEYDNGVFIQKTGNQGISLNSCDFDSIELVPVFQPHKYRLLYSSSFDGTSLVVSDLNRDVYYNEIFTYPSAPSNIIEHYTFQGWQLYGNNNAPVGELVNTSGVSITYDYKYALTLKPVFKGDDITISYVEYDDSAIVGTTTVEYGTKGTQLLVLDTLISESADMNFLGWKLDSTKITGSDGIITNAFKPETNAVTLKADREDIYYSISMQAGMIAYYEGEYSPFDITVEGENSYLRKLNSHWNAFSTPTISNQEVNSLYTFVNWSIYTYDSANNKWEDTGDTINAGVDIAHTYHSNVLLVANFDSVDIDVTYDEIEGFTPNVTSVKYADKTGLDIPTKTNFTFLGWYVGDTQITDADGEMLNIWGYTTTQQLTAHWTGDVYIINLNAQGGSLGGAESSKEVTYGSVFDLPVPTKEYFVFKGWKIQKTNDMLPDVILTDENGNCIEAYNYYDYSKNIWVDAIWEGIEVTINYYDGETQLDFSTTATYNENVTLENYSKDGYTFNGWKLNGSIVLVDENRTTKSKWTRGETTSLIADFTPNTYTVSFSATNALPDAVVPSGTVEVTYGSTEGELGVATLKGYNFAGWCTSTGRLISDSEGHLLSGWDIISNEAVELYPKMNPITCYFRFVPVYPEEEVFEKETDTALYDQDFTFFVPTREGWIFTGWYLNDIALTDENGHSLQTIKEVTSINLKEPNNIKASWYLVEVVLEEDHITFTNDINGQIPLHASIRLRKNAFDQATIEDTYNSSTISWESSDESIATVSRDGIVTCKGYGFATIYAIADNGGKKVACTIGSALLTVNDDCSRLIYVELNNDNRIPVLCEDTSSVYLIVSMAKEYYGYTNSAVIRDSNNNVVSELINTFIDKVVPANGVLHINLIYTVTLKTTDIITFRTAHTSYEFNQQVEIIDIKSKDDKYSIGKISAVSTDGNNSAVVNQSNHTFIMPNYDVNVEIAFAKIDVITGSIVASVTTPEGFEKNTVIAIEKGKASSSEVKVDETKEVVAVYSVSIAQANGEQFTGTYTVRMKTPKEIQGKDGVKAVYKNAAGEMVFTQVDFDGQYMSFTCEATGNISFIANYHESVLNLTWLIIVLSFLDMLGFMVIIIMAVAYRDCIKQERRDALRVNGVAIAPIALLSAPIVASQIAGTVVLAFILGVEIMAIVLLSGKVKEKRILREAARKLRERKLHKNNNNNRATF